jgi:hypothetical protein
VAPEELVEVAVLGELGQQAQRLVMAARGHNLGPMLWFLKCFRKKWVKNSEYMTPEVVLMYKR